MSTSKSMIPKWLIEALPTLIFAGILYLLSQLPESFYDSIYKHIGYKNTLILCTVLIMLPYYYLLSRKNITLKTESIGDPSNSNTDISDSDLCSRPTPVEISDSIYEQPSLLRDEFAKNYIGIHVTWMGTFIDVNDTGNNNVDVCVACDSICFYFPVSLNEYPIFRTLKRESARLKVSGTVDDTLNSIHLKNVQFSFLDQPKN